MRKIERSLFWADKIANIILKKKRFKYIEKSVPKLKEYTVKTSASLSGVLHIGRLSDTIRGESVHKALLDAGARSKLIWVAEDMDPLRKVPKGVPGNYKKYIGMPVTDIPDPLGCHKSYAEHYASEYFKVIDRFVSTRMRKFSMRQEYRKGNFASFIKKILKNMEEVIEIQNRYRSNPLPKNWSPWKPICENCGKIITTQVTDFKDGIVYYKCKDYSFEKTKAVGCGYEGENNPLKFNGKLMWKSEWAAEWARWKVVSEGAGKEYQVPMSAWWVNAEIVERILCFPMPEPIFYEHIMIDGEKMSASRGNVIYPRNWLECAPPELLRFFYNKKLMKTRSFSWKDLPKLYDNYDEHAEVYFGKKRLENKKEELHMKRLFEISQLGKPKKPNISFEYAVLIANTRPSANLGIMTYYARNWLEKHSPESRITLLESPGKVKLTKKMKTSIKNLQKSLEKINFKEKVDLEERVSNAIRAAAKDSGNIKEFFKTLYLILFGKEQGPRLAPYISNVGKDKILKLLKKI